MHRPSDQAKLLFFALLRGTVSALATESKAATGLAGLAVKNNFNAAPYVPSNIQLRLARRTDVASIQRCNLATLPENYNSHFYSNHMRQWPDLCLVAEDVMGMSPENNNSNNNNDGIQEGRIMGSSSFSLGGSYGYGGVNSKSEQPKSKVVAYVLGKVEEIPPEIPSQFYSDGSYHPYGDSLNNQQHHQPEFRGHVTSLAVLQPYRRMGLANALMKQLHYHLEEAYGAGAVGLHVRKSNVAACRLYQQFGYQIDLAIPGYYQDGEDAYYMKKSLQQTATTTSTTSKLKFPFLGRRPARPWESGPMEVRLPRDLEPVQQQPQPQMHQQPQPQMQQQQQQSHHQPQQQQQQPTTTRMDQPQPYSTGPVPRGREQEHSNGLFTGIM